MAHFAKPSGAASSKAMYGLNQHRHVVRITMLKGQSADVVLCLGGTLKVEPTFKDSDIVTVDEKKASSKNQRRFTLKSTGFGETTVTARDKENRPQTAPLQVSIISQDDLSLVKEVSQVLSTSAIQKINFTIEGIAINKSVFAKAKTLIDSGRIAVRSGAAKGTGAYQHTVNTLFLSFLNKKDRNNYPPDQMRGRRALIVHEVTHAMLDAFHAKKIKISVSEAAGYLAGNIFLRSVWPKSAQPPYKSSDAQVHHVAWKIAGHVLSGSKPSASELKELQRVVLEVPAYKSKVAEGNEYYDYDGI